ncbi:MAG: hypothetical protein ACRD29_07470 [Acidimicrobiales bacterium]
MTDLLGPAIIVLVVVVILPVLFLVGGGILAATLGTVLQKTVETDHRGRELVDLNR